MIHRTRTFAAYDPGAKLPLKGYATLAAVFTVTLGTALIHVSRTRRVARIGAGDVLLLGLATHQLSTIVAKDRVLAPFRAPFVKYEESAGAGELTESSRGEGLRKAIGDLVTCPYCMAPWVGGAMVFGFAKKPKLTRWIAATFATVAIADALHQGYAALKKLS